MKEIIGNYQYLFVGGIFGEFLELPFVGNYFLHNKDILIENGAKHVSIFTPSSILPPEQSGRSLTKKVNDLYKKNGLPLIIYAHSKGALDSLYMIFQNTDLVKSGVIFKIILMHGALNGSPVADKIMVGTGKSEGILKITKKSIRQVLNVYKAGSSLTSLHTPRTLELIGKIKQVEGDEFFRKYFVYLIGGKSGKEKTLPIVALTHSYMTKTAPISDGLVVLETQVLPSLDLKTYFYRADHGEYLVSSFLGNKPREKKREFTLDLVKIAFGVPVTYVQEAPENEKDLLAFLASRLLSDRQVSGDPVSSIS